MAKPILAKGVTAWMRSGEAAGRVLSAKIDEVKRHVDEALSGDVDGVHDMRVAVKRLREGLRLFWKLLPRTRAQESMPLVDALNDALGLVRDRDVLIEHAEWVRTQDPSSGPLVDGLEAGWVRDRVMQLDEVVAMWRRLAREEDFERRLRGLAAQTRKRDRPLNALPVDRFAYLTITRRTDAVRTRMPEAAGGQAEPLHRLRISVKRLKYTMEPFLEVLPALPDAYEPVAQAQESLGLTHDFDVLQASMVEQARTARASEEPSSEAAMAVVTARRSELYAAADRDTQVLATEEWHGRLLDALD